MLKSGLIDLAATQALPWGDRANNPPGWRRGLNSNRPSDAVTTTSSTPGMPRDKPDRRGLLPAAKSITSAPASGVPSGDLIVPVIGGPSYGAAACTVIGGGGPPAFRGL